jgi:hypothetical protein
MAISFFTGLMGGVILGYATQGKTTFCKYMLENHATLLKVMGVLLLLGIVLIPSAVLTGAINISATPFFWGGCMAVNFVYGFFAVQCMSEQSEKKA